MNECENEANHLLTKLSSIATPEAVFDNFGAFSDKKHKDFDKMTTLTLQRIYVLFVYELF